MTISLLAGSFIFVQENIRDFNNGITDYSNYREALSLNDLPTVTLCFQSKRIRIQGHQYHFENYVHGKNFTIRSKIFENESQVMALQENKTVNTLFGLGFHMTRLHTEILFESSKPRWQCYKIMPIKWNDSEPIDFKKFGTPMASQSTTTTPKLLLLRRRLLLR